VFSKIYEVISKTSSKRQKKISRAARNMYENDDGYQDSADHLQNSPQAPLLSPEARDSEVAEPGWPSINAPDEHDKRAMQRVISRLCISHFLSAWNSRLFEFGSVLFLASIYPDSLMPVSVYALVRAAAAIFFSPAVGNWIDRGQRLLVVRTSIVGQRLSVAVSCAAFLVLERGVDERHGLFEGLFGLIVALAAIEKLCYVMNSVSVTRDWVCFSSYLGVNHYVRLMVQWAGC
jgi:hypothetical protein